MTLQDICVLQTHTFQTLSCLLVWCFMRTFVSICWHNKISFFLGLHVKHQVRLLYYTCQVFAIQTCTTMSFTTDQQDESQPSLSDIYLFQVPSDQLGVLLAQTLENEFRRRPGAAACWLILIPPTTGVCIWFPAHCAYFSFTSVVSQSRPPAL